MVSWLVHQNLGNAVLALQAQVLVIDGEASASVRLPLAAIISRMATVAELDLVESCSRE